MFADIRGFTGLAERLEDAPDKLTRIINIFLTHMTRVLQARRGTVDKYIGDNIMGFWNAPAEVAHHAYEACHAALEMHAALPAVNAELRDDPLLAGRGGELAIGIGLNTGTTLVGNIGSSQRFNYSVLGDTVNIAARLEGQTRLYGVATIVGEDTREAARAAAVERGEGDFAFLELDLIALKGREQPLRVFALLGDGDMAAGAEFQTHERLHTDMLAAYRGRDWETAARLARTAGDNLPALRDFYAMLGERIAHYKAHPPPEGWYGQFVATRK